MGRKRCAACGERFSPCRHVPDQQYCSKPACQRERRRRWQREKLRRDPDYRANQAVAQRRWCERYRDYWRKYRQSHPDYTARNRARQRERNRNRDFNATAPLLVPIAKMDVCKYRVIIQLTHWLIVSLLLSSGGGLVSFFINIRTRCSKAESRLLRDSGVVCSRARPSSSAKAVGR